ncbi:hypothetical protein B7494_g6709 [Chlorociboria aeruginascens]|nr:hypothetical protein B7494_g6709 [Chlorociboria aeruginascens]
MIHLVINAEIDLLIGLAVGLAVGLVVEAPTIIAPTLTPSLTAPTLKVPTLKPTITNSQSTYSTEMGPFGVKYYPNPTATLVYQKPKHKKFSLRTKSKSKSLKLTQGDKQIG